MPKTSHRLTPASFSAANLQGIIQPGIVLDCWSANARAKGFDVVARVQDRFRLALRCHACSAISIVRYSVVMASQKLLCRHCLDAAQRKTAEAAGMTFLRRDLDHHECAFYRAQCGHEVRRQIGFVARIAQGAAALRCKSCLVIREEAEAKRFGWTRLGRDPQNNANYRLYRHACGHEQRIARANLQWGQCDCAGCGQSWTAKPSFIYLLDIRHQASERHFLKLGYSARPVKRHRHQLGLPQNAQVEVLRVVAMPTGHDACSVEKAAHAELGRTHPEAIVPHPEYADLMNVVSEIYRPSFGSDLHRLLDEIEAQVTLCAAPTHPEPGPQQPGHRVNNARPALRCRSNLPKPRRRRV